MTILVLVEEIARLDSEIAHLERRLASGTAGIADHIRLDAARRLRGSSVRSLGMQSTPPPAAGTCQVRHSGMSRALAFWGTGSARDSGAGV